MKRIAKIIVLLAAAASIAFADGAKAEGVFFGQRGDFGSCRSTVNWNMDRLNGAMMSLDSLTESTKEYIAAYDNKTVKLTSTNQLWALQERLKDFQKRPYKWDKRKWVNYVKKIFIRDCGGFNKKDRDIAEGTGKLREAEKELAYELMLKSKKHIKNWKTIGAYFPGVADYREPTGYDIP